MGNYSFADVSHHKLDLDIQTFADAGHRLCISKASDNYNLPDRDGAYHWDVQIHTDSRFVQNYENTRKVGLVAGAYHYCRWDRPLPVAGRVAIVEANLKYFQDAIQLLPEEHRAIECAILDMEQGANQLQAAGLTKTVVSGMAKDMVTLFAEHYPRLLFYGGSWWTDEWLTAETTEWMAERMGCWEPEYVAIKDNLPTNMAYFPSLPKGFKNEWALTADDYIGKLVAWQFSAGGRFPGIVPHIDINLTQMPKEELYNLFGSDGAVDPPGPTPPPEPDCTEKIREVIDRILEFVQGLRP